MITCQWKVLLNGLVLYYGFSCIAFCKKGVVVVGKDNEIVSIPGLRGRDSKEITLKNLSKIIHARVTEIIERVYAEIKNYGHEDQKKKLKLLVYWERL